MSRWYRTALVVVLALAVVQTLAVVLALPDSRLGEQRRT
jgi:hypothetical protein